MSDPTACPVLQVRYDVLLKELQRERGDHNRARGWRTSRSQSWVALSPPASSRNTRMPDAPQRIQRSRAKGWRMPAGAVYVGRPSKWGNPWKTELVDGVGWCCTDTRSGTIIPAASPAEAHDLAVAHYRAWLDQHRELNAKAAREDLRGKVLCCWCPPHLACHADVLIEIANG